MSVDNVLETVLPNGAAVEAPPAINASPDAAQPAGVRSIDRHAASAARLARLRADMAAHRLDALAIMSHPNRRYMTGFGGSAGIVLVLPDHALLFVDSRYYERGPVEAPACEVVRAGYAQIEAAGKALAEAGLSRCGFEADHVTVSRLDELRSKAEGIDWVAAKGLVESQRLSKSVDEVATIRRAAALTDAGMAHAVHTARPGMTERELAWAIEVFLRQNGASGLAFETIVAGGESGASPHHETSDRVLRAGEPIVIDMGARWGEYAADLTRTFSLGPVDDPDYHRVWDLVDAANRQATAAIRPGRKAFDVDAVARDLITAAGHGEHFGHGLGHGVGMEIHEAPKLSLTSGDIVLAAGSVVTVEPGVYVPGRFGVRIEDLVLVTPDGSEVLSEAPKFATIPLR